MILKCPLCNAFSTVAALESDAVSNLLEHITAQHTTKARKALEAVDKAVKLSEKEDKITPDLKFLSQNLQGEIDTLLEMKNATDRKDHPAVKAMFFNLTPKKRAYMEYCVIPISILKSWGIEI